MKKPPLRTRIRRAWNEIRGQRADYAGANVNRLLLDWIVSARTADEEIKGSIRTLRARARELARNDGYVKHYFRMLKVNVVGPFGFDLQSKTRRGTEFDEETNGRIETAWKAWSQGKVTVDGRHNLRQIQNLLLEAMARDGEAFVRKWRGFERNPHGFALQVIDADMLDETLNREADSRGGNEIRMGVEVDHLGAPVAYHFYGSPRDPFTMGPKTRIPADEILHLYIPERPNQTRGVTWLHSTLIALRMLGGYEEAEVVAARISAAKMAFIELPETSIDSTGGTTAAEWEASPGSLERLAPGEKFVAWDPDHPVAAFGMFIKACLRRVASAVGVSYNVLGNDYEGVNYTSLRHSLLNERDNWRAIQAEWIDQFLTPVYGEWMDMALLSGALELASMDARKYTAFAAWGPRGWPWVDPLKDIQALKEEIALGVDSRTEACAEKGGNYEENLERLAREKKLADEKGVDVSGLKSAAAPAKPDPGDDEDTMGDGEGDSKNGRALVASRRF